MTVERRRPPWVWPVTITMIVLVVAVGFNMLYTQHVNGESNRKWCDIVGTLDDGYKRAPPSSATGKKLAEDMARLRKQLDCRSE